MAAGLIAHADQAQQILQEGKADRIALPRELLYNRDWPVKSVVPSTYVKGMRA